ncbi:MAG: CRISPR-associated helicase Cas3', partial [Bryobacteraceae bacterium]
LRRVADSAADHALPFGAADDARFFGVFHDLGKLGRAFQDRLAGKAHHIDHWSFGAWVALNAWKQNGPAAAICIHGHHTGLELTFAKGKLAHLEPAVLEPSLKKSGLTLSHVPENQALEWLQEQGLALPQAQGSIRPWEEAFGPNTQADTMLDVRMLFSALVDADFLETEAHFRALRKGERYERPKAPPLQADAAVQVLDAYIEQRRRDAFSTPEGMRHLRDEVLEACRAAADWAQGVFTLTAPTGSGKTLSMLAFAFRHALRYQLRRIILVIPYLTIIEQTAGTCREVFEPRFGPWYVLEHHSLAGSRGRKSRELETDMSPLADMVAENWDAPLVVTTSVQLLESLFSNRPAACRKLHRLAASVVLFDEVQTLPVRLAVPTLATLSHLASRYRTTVVFATATQPAFSHLDIGPHGWQPREIVPAPKRVFSRVRRTTIYWPGSDQAISWDELAQRLASQQQVLCIVNLKRHAVEVAKRLKVLCPDSCYHLSTNMCPAHREAVLARVRDCLDPQRLKPCHLVATQCVEAGVDLDFPLVYRAFGPLDAIAQAAGRCNRHGKRPAGEVHIFFPEEDAYPPGGYKQAAEATRALLRSGRVDLDDPATFERYFRDLYQLRDLNAEPVVQSIRQCDFRATAEAYRLIDTPGVDLLVPYDRCRYDALAAEVRADGLSAEWARQARRHSISVFRSAKNAGLLEPVPLASPPTRQPFYSDEWFILLDPDGSIYDRELLGLTGLPQNYWIA